MKKVFILMFVIFFIGQSLPAQITWDGGGADGLWNTPTNWVGDILPGASNDVILDNSVVTGTYIVTLPGGAVTVSIKSVTISPLGTNTISLILPVTNTANPGLNITGSGDAIILNNKALLKNSSGAAAGPGILITNTFRINNGGHYIHNTQRANALLVSQLSTAAGTELGEFEYDVPAGSYTPSLSGRTYGSLTLSALANGGTITYIGSGASNLNILGDLQINTGVTFSISMSANFNVMRNYYQAASSVFNLQSSTNNNSIKVAGNLTSLGTITETGSGQPVLELNGSGNQYIDGGSGAILNSVDFGLNNSAGATLLSNLSLPYRYTITTGNLTLGNNELSTPVINQVGLATSTTNHIVSNGSGALKILSVGAGPVTFPIGPSATTYNPVRISNPILSADFSARVESGINNPPIAFPTFGINRTWYVGASGIRTGVIMGFTYYGIDANPGVSPTEPMELLQSNYSIWSIIPGNTNLIPVGSDPYAVTAATAITINSSLIPYAIGKTGGSLLPLDYFITAHAQKINNNAVINWKVFTVDDVQRFELQRSVNNSNYQTIASINPVLNKLEYHYTDAGLQAGMNRYRIKVSRTSGGALFSNVVAIISQSKELLITSLSPNPVRENTLITISTGKKGVAIFRLYNLSGVLVKQWQSTLDEGTNTITLNTVELPAGVYHLSASEGDEKTLFRLIKQ